MQTRVTPLFRNGIRIQDKKLRPCEGDLNVASSRHPVLGRVCVEANLHSATGHDPLPGLYDVMLDSISANGFRLRGTESGQNGRLQAQEWWCIPLQLPAKD